MRSLGVPAALVGALLAPACSLVTSLDGLSGGGTDSGDDRRVTPMPDGSPLDAGGREASGTESGTLDGDDVTTTDAPGPFDSTAPQDAARDAPPTNDSGPVKDGGADGATTFCASQSPQPLFCEDFDEGSFSVGWSYVHTMGGTLALDQTESRSPPGALIAQSGIAASGYDDVAMYRSFALTGTSTFTGIIDLDFRIDQADATGGLAVIAQLGLPDGSGGGQYFVQLVALSHGAAPLGFSVNEVYFVAGMTNPTVQHALSGTVATQTWTHATFKITAPFASGIGAATLSFNGTQVESSPINVPVKNFSQVLGVGLTFVQTPTNGWTAVYDNVTFAATAQ
jgi:hypothetical protein